MIKFAVIGTNYITERFLMAAKLCDDFCLEAVYSRTEERAKSFADKWGANKIYTDLDSLAKDKDIQAVYLASPNSCHANQAICLMNEKKHVLCEKPIARSLEELTEMLDTANLNGVVLLEAMRSAFVPSFQAVKENLYKLGKIRRAVFSFCQYSSRYDNFQKGIIENTFNPALGNGALMDIGVYCVHAMIMLFGKPDLLFADGYFLENSIDAYGSIYGSYKDMSVQLMYSKINNSFVPNEIQGEKGTMLIEHISMPNKVSIRYNDLREENITFEACEHDMYYELRQFIHLIKTGESCEVWHEYSKSAMAVMDWVREKAAIDFSTVVPCGFKHLL